VAVPSMPQGPGMKERRTQRIEDRARARESRWRHHRYAVPYRTSGPKLTLGILWFAGVVAGALIYAPVAGVLVAGVAVLGGLQTADAHFSGQGSVSRDTSLGLSGGLAGLIALAGINGMFYVGMVSILGVAICIAVAIWAEGFEDYDAVVESTQISIRSAIPVGVAAGSMAALGQAAPFALITLVVLISAYEIGDFSVGTGSANALEGPIAGIAFLGVVAYAARLLPLEPMTAETIIAFAALTAVCCPLGQIFASALLPHGDRWAPALRRLDSYLVAAPLWLLLL
jgi:hypothetical protein